MQQTESSAEDDQTSVFFGGRGSQSALGVAGSGRSLHRPVGNDRGRGYGAFDPGPFGRGFVGRFALAALVRRSWDPVAVRKSLGDCAATGRFYRCKECHPDKLPLSEQWVFGKNGNSDILQNVLVYVSKGVEEKTFEAPKDPVVLDQVGCVYTPHVVAVMTGQTLEVRNSDATLHNVMTMPPPKRNKEFNIGMSVKGGKVRKVFNSPEFNIRLMCMLHPWMKAYVHVLPHPFFAVTRADGTFTLKGLPPGEYEISVRHESSSFEAEPSVAKIKVEAGETRTADFTYRKKKQ